MLTDEEKRSIITQRLAQLAAERFQHELNSEVCEAIGDEAGLANAASAIATLTVAIEVHEAKLSGLS